MFNPFFLNKINAIKCLALVCCCLLLSSCVERPPELVSLTGETMGTTYMVKYLDDVEQKDSSKQIQAQLDSLLIDINQLMSTYIVDSELSLLNKAPAGQAVKLSNETSFVLEEAIRLHGLSDGMLDITVGPLVNLWGFGPQAKPEKIPNAEQLNILSEYVGIDKFSFSNNEIIKHHQQVYIDLSTIAKGYAVDRIAQLLSDKGLNNYLVEIGGEMRLSGHKARGQNWLIAIEKPISGLRAIQRTVSIGDNAIASSGDYRNYYEEDGIRYSHLINPKTGYPIQHNLVSVSVVAPTCIEADGLATALIVMGTEGGIALAEKNGIAALFITKEGEEFVEYQSSAFREQVTLMP